MIPYVELKTQFLLIEHEIRAALDEVFESGRFILGPQLTAFEEEFAAYLSMPHVVGVASGTEAIQLALMAAGIGPGDEVITAANTCVPTICGIVGAGATPRLADVDPVTLTLDPASIERAITPHTKAIVPVHLYGHPCDMDALRALANQHEIALVEDCAQAHGAEYRGVRCGAFGAASAFSFYPTKNLGAYGDAGAVATHDAGLAAELRMLRNYGEERRYLHTQPGLNSRLDEMQAAILRVKLRHLEDWTEARRERAAEYSRLLAGTPLTLPCEADYARHNYHLYVVRSSHRDALQRHLEARGVGTLIHYPIPVHLQPAYAGLGYGPGDFPNAERACDEVLSLPMYPELPLEHVQRVAEAISEFRA